MTLNQILKKKISLKFYQWARISRGLKTAKKMAYGKPSSLVVEFQTKIYFQIWFNIKKYVEAQAILRFGSMIFKPLHTEVCTKNFEAFASP